MKDVKYTELFYSIQGEALNTGKLCTWLRLYLCSLQCRGFGQVEPGNPATWAEQYPLIDVKNITELEKVPTPSTGCDSAYSWSAQFKHLVKTKTTRELATEIRASSGQKNFGKIGHVFTGGEPLMQQEAIAEIINHWIDDEDYPAWIGFETNVTQRIKPVLRDAIKEMKNREVFVYFSMSPKLLHVSGEEPKKAIHIDLMLDYLMLCPHSYLKFVLNEDQRAWDQAQKIVYALIDDVTCDYWVDPEVWVMPVGGVIGQQLDPAVGRIADKAINEYQWNVSPRVHVLIWGDDQIGR